MDVIHALPVGGGILAIAPMPGASGSYADDLEHVKNWRPALVLSLVTRLELYMAGAERFGSDMMERGTRWDQLEIEDGQAPDAAFDTRWVAVSGFARRALLGGGRVLVHCKAGCGRSGMAALRLMIEMGEAPDEALPRLRAVRPCAVETEAQMRWALAAKPEPSRFVRHS
ncbi:Dual specificity phosphatase, catalytic domain [Roseivivax halotolerans]|jgi:protein-tyrosine phosphatase|uniref:Dual specificity phosphatase, catalytic domain n=1 Tax=Roseivivax halotolerans TaxID=93684 RepID=A0A1I5ULG5_9RHOB|nr:MULTISPECIES: protein-tyrosine phosphatase family protein [Roseivivax]QFT64524.1 Dual specificity phosphatase, catalytic domain [Roseivivax sp. THAF30]SFP96133.1 Dual specificity phosphatase, catalytic domain [Roseivivax halotolerans]